MRTLSMAICIAVMTAGLIPAAAAAQQKEKSEFDRAIERASREAKEQGERERSEKAQREGNQARSDAGVGHDGMRYSTGKDTSVGASGSHDPATGETRGTVNVRQGIP